jgi:thioredoxin 1
MLGLSLQQVQTTQSNSELGDYLWKECGMRELNYVTEETFQSDVLEADMPVLVDFTAVWCGPCKMLSPLVEELAQLWAGKAKVLKMDVDTNQVTPQKYGVMGVPSLILFKDGEVASRITGFRPKKQLISTFEPHLT